MSVEAGKVCSGMHDAGRCVLRNEAIDGLTEEMFSHPKARKIFAAAVTAYWQGKKVDGVTLIGLLPEEKDTLLKLADQVPTLRHGMEYIQIVRDDWQKRTIGEGLNRIAAEACSRAPEDSLESLKELIREQELLLRAKKESGLSFSQALERFIEWMKSPKGTENIRCGIRCLDRAMGGFLPGSVTALCARAGGGKTDFAVNLAVRAAKQGAQGCSISPWRCPRIKLNAERWLLFYSDGRNTDPGPALSPGETGSWNRFSEIPEKARILLMKSRISLSGSAE